MYTSQAHYTLLLTLKIQMFIIKTPMKYLVSFRSKT